MDQKPVMHNDGTVAEAAPELEQCDVTVLRDFHFDAVLRQVAHVDLFAVVQVPVDGVVPGLDVGNKTARLIDSTEDLRAVHPAPLEALVVVVWRVKPRPGFSYDRIALSGRQVIVSGTGMKGTPRNRAWLPNRLVHVVRVLSQPG